MNSVISYQSMVFQIRNMTHASAEPNQDVVSNLASTILDGVSSLDHLASLMRITQAEIATSLWEQATRDTIITAILMALEADGKSNFFKGFR